MVALLRKALNIIVYYDIILIEVIINEQSFA